MFNFKPELRANETVIGEYGAFVYRSDGHHSSLGDPIRLWLTDQRLILKKSPLAPQRSLSLHAITDIREQQITSVLMVRIEFTNGHVEWLNTFQDQAQFLDALRVAQAKAPEIPEEVVPGTASPSVPTALGGRLLLPIILGVCLIICSCLFLTALGLLWFIASMR